MIKITTYFAKPYFLLSHPLPFTPKSATDWLRVVINQLYNSNKARLHKTGVRTELFHNHDELTSATRTLYPLIIYHYLNTGFYVTGINEGAVALKELLEPFERAVDINKNFLLKFELAFSEEREVKNSDTEQRYRLVDWLPLKSDAYKRYQTLTLIEKIGFLESQLAKHITNDFGKFLDLDLSETRVNILAVDNLKRSSLPYKSHDYQPFSFEFSANANLPDFITLGNGKAFGFGRVERIS